MLGCGYVAPKATASTARLSVKDKNKGEPTIIYGVGIDGGVVFGGTPSHTMTRMTPGKHTLNINVIVFYQDHAKEDKPMEYPILVKAGHRYTVKFFPDQRRLKSKKASVNGTLKIYDNGRVIVAKRLHLTDSPTRIKPAQLQQELVNDAIMTSIMMSL
jgi:hypothetical protein